jgi:hypothetical protein
MENGGRVGISGRRVEEDKEGEGEGEGVDNRETCLTRYYG